MTEKDPTLEEITFTEEMLRRLETEPSRGRLAKRLSDYLGRYKECSVLKPIYQALEYVPGIVQFAGVLGTALFAATGKYEYALIASSVFLLAKIYELDKNYRRQQQIDKLSLQNGVLGGRLRLMEKEQTMKAD